MERLANNLLPTIIVLIVVVLLAVVVVYNSNRNQREVIDAVRQDVKDRESEGRMESLKRQ